MNETKEIIDAIMHIHQDPLHVQYAKILHQVKSKKIKNFKYTFLDNLNELIVSFDIEYKYNTFHCIYYYITVNDIYNEQTHIILEKTKDNIYINDINLEEFFKPFKLLYNGNLKKKICELNRIIYLLLASEGLLAGLRPGKFETIFGFYGDRIIEELNKCNNPFIKSICENLIEKRNKWLEVNNGSN